MFSFSKAWVLCGAVLAMMGPPSVHATEKKEQLLFERNASLFEKNQSTQPAESKAPGAEKVWRENDGSMRISNLLQAAPSSLRGDQAHLLCLSVVKEQLYNWVQTMQITWSYYQYLERGTAYESPYYDKKQMQDLVEVMRVLFQDAGSEEKEKVHGLYKDLNKKSHEAFGLWLLMDKGARVRPFSDLKSNWYFTLPSGEQIDAALEGNLAKKYAQRHGYESVVQLSASCVENWRPLEVHLKTESEQIARYQKEVSKAKEHPDRDALLQELETRYKKEHVTLRGDRFKDDLFFSVLWTFDPSLLDELMVNGSPR